METPERTARGRSLRNRWNSLAIVAVATVVATVLVWLAAAQTGRQRAERDLRDELNVLRRSVQSEIERFRYLPAVVGREGRIRSALASRAPGAVAAANRYLKQVRSDSGADELYVMTPDGLTIAASNYDEASSFIGNNYRFRPVFQAGAIDRTGPVLCRRRDHGQTRLFPRLGDPAGWPVAGRRSRQGRHARHRAGLAQVLDHRRPRRCEWRRLSCQPGRLALPTAASAERRHPRQHVEDPQI